MDFNDFPRFPLPGRALEREQALSLRGQLHFRAAPRGALPARPRSGAKIWTLGLEMFLENLGNGLLSI